MKPWENIFSNNDTDTNIIFDNFLDTFLKIFNASFSEKEKKHTNRDNKIWLTSGIIILCNN